MINSESNKYKIAIVVPGFEYRGGVATVAKFIYRVLAHSEHYQPHIVSLATSSRDQSSVRLFSPASWRSGVQVISYNSEEGLVQHVGAFLAEFEFQRYMPRKPLTTILDRFDLIQVVSGGPAPANVAKNLDKPICLFAATAAVLERRASFSNSGFARKNFNRLTLPLISDIERQAMRRVHHVFAESSYTREAFLSYVHSSKISIDTIGVDTRRFCPLSAEHRTSSYILSVGRLADPRKNVTLLFEAYSRLCRTVPDAPALVLAGNTPPTQAAWTHAKKLGIADRIAVKRDVSLEELIELYQNAVFFVLASNEEGLGIVLLEAMACATPVVSTRSGGPDSVVTEDVGFLTPVGNAEVLANRMKWMLEHPHELRTMGQAGREMVESRFSYEVVGKKYLDVYDRLLRGQ